MSYADRVRSLDPTDPQEMAMVIAIGAGAPRRWLFGLHKPRRAAPNVEHSAIASTYAHVTAPLRRVCDRYTNEVLLAICGGYDAPQWALDTLPELPSIMGRTRQRESALERSVVDFMEAKMLEPSVGEEFDATVVNHRRDKAVIALRDPAIIAQLSPKPQLGQELRVRLRQVDVEARLVTFERVKD